jgi:hypothetical protein
VPELNNLSPGYYTVEFGVADESTTLNVAEGVEPFLFPEGRDAARLTAAGEVVDTPEAERLNRVTERALPPAAESLDRVYDGKIRLAAFQLDPPRPRPGQTVDLFLYWQVVDEMLEPVHLTVQLADSRSLPLGRRDSMPPMEKWIYGDVVTTSHRFKINSDFEGPVAGRVEVQLKNEAGIFLQPTTEAGEKLDKIAGRFTIAPDVWPTLANTVPVDAVWQVGEAASSIGLQGYTLSPEQPKPGVPLTVNLFWVAERSIAEDYTVFVHLVDENGQIRSQNDSLPRAGAYPTSWWLPETVVEDIHMLALPEDLPAGTYHLAVGLYNSENGVRLRLTDGQDSFVLDTIEMP